MAKEIKINITRYSDDIKEVLKQVFEAGVLKFVENAFSQCNPRRKRWAIDKNNPNFILQSAIEDEIDRIATETLPEEVYENNMFEGTESLEEIAEDITEQIACSIDLNRYLNKGVARVDENVYSDLITSKINGVFKSVLNEYMKHDYNYMINEELNTGKLPDRQKRVWQKAMKYLTEARDMLYCCDSPFSHPRDQQRVSNLFNEFVAKLKAL